MTEESNEGAMDAARAALKEHFGYDVFVLVRKHWWEPCLPGVIAWA